MRDLGSSVGDMANRQHERAQDMATDVRDTLKKFLRGGVHGRAKQSRAEERAYEWGS